MAEIMKRRSMTAFEVRVLATLCALMDEGTNPTGNAAAKALGENSNVVHSAIAGLQGKGWVDRNVPVKGVANPVRIVIRPANVERHHAYRDVTRISEFRHPADQPEIRPCMTCGDDFNSDGWANRRCPKCRGSQKDGGAWMGDVRASAP